MNLWLAAAVALLCAFAGVVLGLWFSRSRSPYWTFGYLMPLALALLEDHWVTVLEVTDSEVVVGDPLAGLTRLPYDEFCKRWRFIGIVLNRKMPL